MRLLLCLWLISSIMSGCRIYGTEFSTTNHWFELIENTYRKELMADQLYPYDCRILVSKNENRIMSTQNDKVIIYLLPYEKIKVDEKMLLEEYFQQVRHLYPTRQDFINEYYTVFKTCLIMSDLVLYGLHDSKLEVSNTDIFVFSITFLKKHKQLGVNTDRLAAVYTCLAAYYKNTLNKNSKSLFDEEAIISANKAFELSKVTGFDETKKKLSTFNFSK